MIERTSMFSDAPLTPGNLQEFYQLIGFLELPGPQAGGEGPDVQAVAPVGLPAIATIALVAASLPTAIRYRQISKINYNAEESLPSFIRDITESQKNLS